MSEERSTKELVKLLREAADRLERTHGPPVKKTRRRRRQTPVIAPRPPNDLELARARREADRLLSRSR